MGVISVIDKAEYPDKSTPVILTHGGGGDCFVGDDFCCWLPGAKEDGVKKCAFANKRE